MPSQREPDYLHGKDKKGNVTRHEPPIMPWGETPVDFRERVEAENRWNAYLCTRAAYRMRGLPNTWATRFAMQHFAPANYPTNTIKTGVPADQWGLQTGVTELQTRAVVAEMLGLGDSTWASEFDGRTCTFEGALTWVAEHLGVKVIQQNAPSRMAWSVYQWASSHPAQKSKFYELYLSRRYRPEKAPDDEFDPTEGLSDEGEDIGLSISGQSEIPDALPADSAGSAGEQPVAAGDEFARF